MDIAVVWLIAGLALMLAELFVPGFVILFFGLGGLVTGVAVWLFPGMGAAAQGLCFAVSSVLTLALGRRYCRNLLGGREERTGGAAYDDGFVGATVVVAEAIRPPLPGRVLLNGAEWPAEAARPIEKGATARVVARDNITLKVE